jgi:hypothetical protein
LNSGYLVLVGKRTRPTVLYLAVGILFGTLIFVLLQAGHDFHAAPSPAVPLQQKK